MTTNSNDPDRIRAEIDQNRRDLSRNIDTLGEQVQPSTMARRQGNKISESIHDGIDSVKERIMGSDDDYDGYYGDDRSRTDEMRDRAQGVADDARGYAHDAQRAVQNAPRQARRKTQGNPLAAGLIALGAGWLLGSLLPSSTVERRVATDLKDRAEPLIEDVKGAAQEMGENLKPQAEQAAAHLKESATESAQNVKGQAQGAAQDVQGSAKQAKDDVQGTAKDEAQQAKQQKS